MSLEAYVLADTEYNNQLRVLSICLEFPDWQQHVDEGELLSGDFDPARDGEVRRRIIARRRELERLTVAELGAVLELQRHHKQRAQPLLQLLPSCPSEPGPARSHWAVAPFWRAHEAGVLFRGLDPDLWPSDLVKPLIGVLAEADAIARACELVERAMAVGDLPERPAPVDVLDWGAGRGLKVLPGLAKAVRALPRKSYKKLYEEASAEREALRTAAPLDPRERNSLIVMLHVLLTEAGHKPELQRNSTVAWLKKRIEARGFRLDENTVRKFVKEAAERMPRKPETAIAPARRKPE